jgi:hypothetical protein
MLPCVVRAAGMRINEISNFCRELRAAFSVRHIQMEIGTVVDICQVSEGDTSEKPLAVPTTFNKLQSFHTGHIGEF